MTGGEPRLTAPAGAAVWLLGLGVPILLGGLLVVLGPQGDQPWAMPAFTLVAASWGTVGSLIATRRPRLSVGWVVWAIGVWLAVTLAGQAYGFISATRADGTLPFTMAALWAGGLLFNVVFGFAFVGLPLCFPDGRLPSPRWRLLLAVVVAAMVVQTLATAVHPGELPSFPGVANPTGIRGLAAVAQPVADLSNVVFLLCIPLCVAAPFVRYRRGSLMERQQLKWFGSATALAVVAILGATTLPEPWGVAMFGLAALAIGLVPVSIAIAVLRYHLYEIDRIVGRTLSYGALTALLAIVFLGTNLALQAVLAGAFGDSTLITAVSTLVVAGLFQPLRRGIQGPIDRRFNRARVDGERVVEAFAGQLRDQVDLDRLRASVVLTVRAAVAPTTSSVWLRSRR